MRARDFVRLTKLPIAAVSTLSAATGFAAGLRGWSPAVLITCAGTLLMAMGACALNQWQERDLDARMERTRGRPIPVGSVSPREALALSVLLILAGGSLLFQLFGFVPAGLGCLAVLWYNGLYTPLKRVTAFAVVPGAVIGAIPPAIGWTAAGGSAADPKLWALAFFFFVWQVPHFWLLLFKYGEEYARAGFPSLTRIFGRTQLCRLTSAWILATAAASLLLPLYGVSLGRVTAWGLAVLGAVLSGFGLAALLAQRSDRVLRGLFVWINAYACLVMALVAADPLWPH